MYNLVLVHNGVRKCRDVWCNKLSLQYRWEWGLAFSAVCNDTCVSWHQFVFFLWMVFVCLQVCACVYVCARMCVHVGEGGGGMTWGGSSIWHNYTLEDFTVTVDEWDITTKDLLGWWMDLTALGEKYVLGWWMYLTVNIEKDLLIWWLYLTVLSDKDLLLWWMNLTVRNEKT